MNITWIGAHINNFEKGRRHVQKPSTIILHWMAGTIETSDSTFLNPDRLASVHYGVKDTTIHQYVKEENTAFHAGTYNTNLQSIGITVEGSKEIEITDESYRTLSQLIESLCRRYGISIDRDHIKGHNELVTNTTQFEKDAECPGTLDVSRVIIEALARTPLTKISKIKEERNTVTGYLVDLSSRLGVPVANRSMKEIYDHSVDFIRENSKKMARVNEDNIKRNERELKLIESIDKLYEQVNTNMFIRLAGKIKRLWSTIYKV